MNLGTFAESNNARNASRLGTGLMKFGRMVLASWSRVASRAVQFNLLSTMPAN